jgi:predicted transglutaminase-like protease
VKDDLYSINDLLIMVNNKRLPALIYEVVFNIFEELILLCEDVDMFETAQNILNFRDMWFLAFGVKIMRVTREKK